MKITVDNMNAQTITPAPGRNNDRQLHEHQVETEKALDEINRQGEFRTLLVLPTGGRIKGPAKRTPQQNQNFEAALLAIIEHERTP